MKDLVNELGLEGIDIDNPAGEEEKKEEEKKDGNNDAAK